MKILKYSFLILLLIISFKPAHALDPDREITQYMQTVWSIKDGLPSDTTTSVIQDSNGFIWVGTYEGLTRFDGVEFTQFNKYTHEAYNSTSARILLEQSDGSLWIGTNGDGLVCYRNNKFHMITEEDGLPDNSIRSLLEDSRGRIWVGTVNGLAFIKDGSVMPLISAEKLKHSRIDMLYQDSRNNIWAGSSEGGLYLVRDDTCQIPESFVSLSETVVISMLEDKHGSIWLGTNDAGVLRIRQNKIEFMTRDSGLTIKSANSMIEDRHGVIWIGSESGLIRFNNGRFDIYSEKNGLISNTIKKMCEDHEGNLWLSTSRGGLTKLSNGKFISYSTKEGLVHNTINAIAEDSEGRHWIGTNAGLTILKAGRPVDHPVIQTLASTRIRHIFRDRKGTMRISTYGKHGFVSVDGDHVTHLTTKDGLISDRCRMALEDSRGDIWIGTTRGLNQIGPREIHKYTRSNGLSNDYVMCLFEGDDGSIWVGTDGGGVNVLKDGKITVYNTENGLAGNVVFKITRDSQGTIWVATTGGVSRYSQGKLINYTQKSGFSSDAIFQIIEDENNLLWMSTNRGIFTIPLLSMDRYESGDLKTLPIQRYDMSDGLRAGVIATSWGMKDSLGKIWFPTMDGVAVIDPSNIPRNREVPPILLDRVTIDHQEMRPEKFTNLGYDYKRITFDYTALSYVEPGKVKFRYKLDGFDEKWSTPSFSRMATYTTLKPGNYTFRVKAANNDGLWNEEHATVSFYQKPYFYNSPVFYVIIVLLFISFAFLLFHYRTRNLKKSRDILGKRVNDRTLELKVVNTQLQNQMNEKYVLEETLRVMFDFSPDAYGIIDKNGFLQHINHGTETILGYDREEILGRSIFDLNLFEIYQVPEVKYFLHQMDHSTAVEPQETWIRKKDRSKINLEVSSHRVAIHGRNVLLYIARDITERKKTQELIVQTEKMLSVGGLAAGMAHEINNPLAGMMQSLQVMRHRLSGNIPANKKAAEACDLSLSSLREYMDKRDIFKLMDAVKESGERAANIVKNMLSFSQKNENMFVSSNLVELLEKTLGLIKNDYNLKSRYDFRKIEIVREYQEDVPSLLCESSKIQQVFLNVLKNGAQAMSGLKKEGYLPCFHLRVSYSKKEIRVEIEDNGPGMDESVRKRVFEPFYTTKNVSTGTGLGMSVSYFIIRDLHGGNIEVESKNGNGTTFIISLPITNPN